MLLSLSVPLTLALAQAPQDFGTATVLAAALDGQFRGQGDFDGDGDRDLLHFTDSAAGPTGFSVFRNHGHGVFVRGPVVPFSFPANYTSSEAQPGVADFDGDGKLDFVLPRGLPLAAVGQGVELFRGDGVGGIAARVLLPLVGPRWVGAGNIDGDAASEVAVCFVDTNFQTHLAWIDFANGVPVLGTTLPIVPGVVPNPFVFTVLDVDGDGDADIAATASTTSNHDTVQFFTTVGGVPTVGASFAIPPALQNVNHRLLAGDLDGDGDRDLLLLQMLPNDPGPDVQAFERTPSGWNQRPAQMVPTPGTGWFAPHNAWLVDWDGDGWLDVATMGLVTDVLRAAGNWTFVQGFETLGSGQREGGGPGDLDGDGRADLVAGQTILWGDGSFGGANPTAFAAGLVLDREGDGDLDLSDPAGAWFATNDATGAFVATTRSLPPLPPGHFATPIAYADFDGNGRRELLAMYSQQGPLPFQHTPLGTLRIAEDGRGGFEPPVLATNLGDVIGPPPLGANSRHWHTGDADGDGDLDLLLPDGYRQNNGSGRFDVFVPAYVGRGRAVADVDSNGFVDVLVTRYSAIAGTSELWIHLGASGGGSARFVATLSGEVDAAFRDLDGDGDLDVVAASPTQPGLFPFEHVGGTFVAASPLPTARVPELAQLGVFDGDHDGVLDLQVILTRAVANAPALTTLARLRGTGVGLGYQLQAEHLAPAGTTGFADVDADGDLDAIGSQFLRSRLVPAGAGGAVQQYGNGVPGTGGFVPQLGATGPVLSTSGRDELRLVDGLGGAPWILVVGLVQSAILGAPLPGLVQYVGDPLPILLPPLGGAPGVPGAGSRSLVLPDLPGLLGFSFVHQAFLLDPGAAAGWSATNGLRITYGL